MAEIDDGTAVHYLAVPKGVPVYSADEQVVGTMIEVLDNHREHIMDGVVFDDPDGVRRFVDAPEVARTAECGVTLSIRADEASQLAPPDNGPGAGGLGAGGTVKRLFGGVRRR